MPQQPTLFSPPAPRRDMVTVRHRPKPTVKQLDSEPDASRKTSSTAKPEPLPEDEADRLLTIDQAAVQLSVSRRTLYRMIAAGDFPKPVRVAGSRRVPLSELVEFLDGLKRKRA